MILSDEQYQDFAAQENELVWREIEIDLLVKETIPIYTMKRPNPKSGKEDCPITTREKERFRARMKTKLEAAKTEDERQKVIDHYKEKWSE